MDWYLRFLILIDLIKLKLFQKRYIVQTWKRSQSCVCIENRNLLSRILRIFVLFFISWHFIDFDDCDVKKVQFQRYIYWKLFNPRNPVGSILFMSIHLLFWFLVEFSSAFKVPTIFQLFRQLAGLKNRI